MHISNDGYEGKRSNFYGYCKRLMKQHNLEYHTQKNIVVSLIHWENSVVTLSAEKKSG